MKLVLILAIFLLANVTYCADFDNLEYNKAMDSFFDIFDPNRNQFLFNDISIDTKDKLSRDSEEAVETLPSNKKRKVSIISLESTKIHTRKTPIKNEFIDVKACEVIEKIIQNLSLFDINKLLKSPHDRIYPENYDIEDIPDDLLYAYGMYLVYLGDSKKAFLKIMREKKILQLFK